jgi:hypothetical protein
MHPNDSRPVDAKRLGLTWEFMDRIAHVCYFPTGMHVMRTMLGVTNWDKRIYQMGRDWLVSQTHLNEGTISTYVQYFVRDGLLTETISKKEVQFEKHRQNYKFNIPDKPILDCRLWLPHAHNKHHNEKLAETFALMSDKSPLGGVIQLGKIPEVTDPWAIEQSYFSPF